MIDLEINILNLLLCSTLTLTNGICYIHIRYVDLNLVVEEKM